MHEAKRFPVQALLRTLSPAARQGTGPLARLLRAGGLHCVFQPLADLREGNIYSHEALIRGPAGTVLQAPDALLAQARTEGILHDFELLCVAQALLQWGVQATPGRLFINISANALVWGVGLCGADPLADVVRRLGVPPHMVVLEITEHERVADLAPLRDALRQVHACGMRLALDDFGDGHSSLRLWSEVRPDFVKIDKYFTRDIGRHPEKLQMLQAIRGIADTFGTTLVAEGIETSEELRALRDLDIPYGQGYLLGRPAPAARQAIEAPALAVLRDRRVAVLPHSGQHVRPGILRNLLMVQAPTVTPQTSNDSVAALFRTHGDLHAIAVLEGVRPVALINRQQFMNHYATLYFREVHGRKPCRAFADDAPRVVEIDCDVEALVGILTSQDQRYLNDGFIVTDNGRYLGLGTGEQLVRGVTEARIEAARHANPLTFLPGNIPISLHMQRLLDNHAEFVACYADLNHFKPFNDHYGYWRGDQMIRLVAREAMALFDEPARREGGIWAEDRHGVQRFFGCTTLSIGAVRVAPGSMRQAEEVANLAALSKRDAKQSHAGIAWRDAVPGAGAWRSDGRAQAQAVPLPGQSQARVLAL